MSDHSIDRLRALDASALSDACDRLGIEGRVTTALRPTAGPTRIGGRIVTVLLGRPGAGPPSDGEARHLGAAATDAATADDVIVVAHQGRADCAGWGGNLSRAARRRGVAGTIVHGAVRDVDEAAAIGYPVFATGASPRTARGRAEEHAWGGPVEIDGIAVDSGDYVVADTTGVVFIAAADIDRVLDAAEAIATTEAAMAAEIDAGRPISDVMGVSYETMLE